MLKKIALFPGSFDPIHDGHIHIIKKAIHLFDEVIVCVCININKKQKNSLLTRKKQILATLKTNALGFIKVVTWNKYVVDAAQKYQANYLIAGIRNLDDMKQQLHNATVNKKLNQNIETVFLISDAIYQNIASSKIQKVIDAHNMYFEKNKK